MRGRTGDTIEEGGKKGRGKRCRREHEGRIVHYKVLRFFSGMSPRYNWLVGGMEGRSENTLEFHISDEKVFICGRHLKLRCRNMQLVAVQGKCRGCF